MCVQAGYKERPDYEMLKGLFHHTLKSGGMSDDYSGLDWIDQVKICCNDAQHHMCVRVVCVCVYVLL